ncbi:MAG: MaoC family dehydratase N-terminal domain-containing protein [Acidobacteriota bacterium]|nr:MaoC family dehydratase N-terminal domain-containing protein [Acidobacteriota bacterium]
MAVKSFPVEASHILMFARAVNDGNPIYSDANYAKSTEPGKVIAPPTFVQASAQFDPDYPLRPQVDQTWFGSGKEGTGTPERQGGGPGGLHAEQEYTYHRQLSPGDVLTGESKPGKTWEKQGRRGGSLKFTESITEYRDQSGELVVTARSVGVLPSKVVES